MLIMTMIRREEAREIVIKLSYTACPMHFLREIQVQKPNTKTREKIAQRSIVSC